MKRLLILIGFLLIGLTSCQSAPAPTSVPPSPTPELSTPTPTPAVTPTPISGSERVKLGDSTLYYEVQGAGKPLILLHGGLASADAWVNQITVFAQHYRVIALDSRGQGRTTDAEAPITYHRIAEDTVGLIDYLGIDAAYVVGWSDGGIVGLDLAIHHPERVIALVAYGAHSSLEGLQESVVASV